MELQLAAVLAPLTLGACGADAILRQVVAATNHDRHRPVRGVA